MSEVSLPQMFEQELKNVILEAGEIAKKFKKKISVNYKSKNQPVTNADIQIDRFLKLFFKEKTPEYGWVSEESEDNKSRFNSDYFWCLDPIDGTRSYINGKPEYTISLALIKGNSPIMGIILNPETEELFFAIKDKGAYCNDKKINVRKNIKLSSSVYGISSSESKDIERYDFFNKKNIVKMGSIAYKIALVAKGKIDIALSFTKKNDWDVAASGLILEEAGGVLKDMSGKNITYNTKKMKIDSVIASNRELQNQLCLKLNEKK